MTKEERYARLVLEIDERFRGALHEALAATGLEVQDREEVAAAVVALLVRRMYQQRGQVWLERILQMVLQP